MGRTSTVPVTAEIVPVPMAPGLHPPMEAMVGGDHVMLASSASSGAITSSSFMPSNAVSEAAVATLPRSLENGYRLQSVNSRLTSSPVLVDTHVRSSSLASGAASSTMPRNMHHINGNSTEHHPPPPPLPPHQIASVKKKSVTINTFTTVVEPFEEEEEIITSAV